MSNQSDCIFCKIVQGEIPSSKIYEDEEAVAFLDLSQVTKGHTLLIPKDHQENIFSLNEETAAKLFSKVPEIARALKKTFNCDGLNIVNNNGEKADQSIFHYHLHFIPRYGDDILYHWVDNSDKYTTEDLQSYAQDVKANLE
ncbi:histidine triad (HIT) family protein [Geomicrobium halophilum]|uniref:Histidine triad (HIT) family protein n=1 Tax=Geomicrobium halophilum TaxID=549000 RepID=A0A841PP10_9BACL|nr:HIT family protein [Geomicrobium halophilum]MBB6449534.1 histidine triad (HIT) family protein [Geomicrobium halophilum]